MSISFACGKGGCHARVWDDDAVAKADASWRLWNLQQRAKTGHFPRLVDQEEFWMKAYEAAEMQSKIKIHHPDRTQEGEMI